MIHFLTPTCRQSNCLMWRFLLRRFIALNVLISLTYSLLRTHSLSLSILPSYSLLILPWGTSPSYILTPLHKSVTIKSKKKKVKTRAAEWQAATGQTSSRCATRRCLIRWGCDVGDISRILGSCQPKTCRRKQRAAVRLVAYTAILYFMKKWNRCTNKIKNFMKDNIFLISGVSLLLLLLPMVEYLNKPLIWRN